MLTYFTIVREINVYILITVQVPDKHGITPLLAAIYEGHTECVKLLLAKVIAVDNVNQLFFPSGLLQCLTQTSVTNGTFDFAEFCLKNQQPQAHKNETRNKSWITNSMVLYKFCFKCGPFYAHNRGYSRGLIPVGTFDVCVQTNVRSMMFVS